jgi:cobalt-zinc-cadmium efflux system outer membrane protein
VKRALLVAVLSSGCATVSAEKGHDEIARILVERTGSETGWEKGAPEHAAIAARVDALSSNKLTRKNAVAIALLNNPGLQATYDELGVSQADMVQAGLLSNPSFGGSIGFPIGGIASGLEPEFSIVQNIVDLFTMPWRKETARDQFKADTLRVAHEALGVVEEVNTAFVTHQAELESGKLLRQTLEGAEAAQLLAEKQFAAGNISELAYATQQVSFAQLQMELTHAEVRVGASRERLNRLLGLWGKRANWELAEALPELPAADAIPERPESHAVRMRLDIQAARIRAEVLAQIVGLARSTRLFGHLEVGIHYHQDPDGPRLLGPTLSLELPIFDQRQAYIAKLEAEQQSAARRVSALAVNARSKVREGILSLQANRAMAQHFSQTLVPLREKVVEQAQLHYNGMLIGLPSLMAARLEGFETRRGAIAARRDYWIARFELESALGSALPLAAEKKHEH